MIYFKFTHFMAKNATDMLDNYFTKGRKFRKSYKNSFFVQYKFLEIDFTLCN